MRKARHAEINQAAFDVFSEMGFAATRLDSIATRAGISKGTLYLYFESKYALFKSVVDEVLSLNLRRVDALAEEANGSAAESLRNFVSGWWDVANAQELGALMRLLVAEGQNYPEVADSSLRALSKRTQAAMSKIIAGGVARGEFREINPEMAACVLFSAMSSHLLLGAAFGQVDSRMPARNQRFSAGSIDIILFGINGT